MMTCIRVGQYPNALTRGKQYECVKHDAVKLQVRVRGDNNRTRWFPSRYFDFTNSLVVLLADWEFDDPVIDELNGRDETNNYVEVRMRFNDGTLRWCGFMTPEYLKRLLERRSNPAEWGGANEPALWSTHTIFIRDLRYKTVDWTLRYMDSQGELLAHTLPVTDELLEEE